jgi:hypothetical protein
MKLMFCFSMLFYSGSAQNAKPQAVPQDTGGGINAVWAIITAALIIIALSALFLALIERSRKRKRGAIIGSDGEYRGARFNITNGEEVIIGTDAGLSNVVLSGSDGALSRKHCGIRYDRKKNLYYVTDYSANGTFTKAGKRMQVGRQNPVRGGSVIYLGNRGNMFRLL